MRQTDQLTHKFTYTLYVPSVSQHFAKTWSGITWTTHKIFPTPATDLAITTNTRVVPHAPKDATEPDKQYQRTQTNRSKDQSATSTRYQSRNPGTTLRSDLAITARPDLNNTDQTKL